MSVEMGKGLGTGHIGAAARKGVTRSPCLLGEESSHPFELGVVADVARGSDDAADFEGLGINQERTAAAEFETVSFLRTVVHIRFLLLLLIKITAPGLC